MAAAADDVAAMPEFFDVDFSLDDFDFDLAADEFRDAYSAFVANADADKSAAPGGWLAASGVDCGCREDSPDSAVTDGPLAAEGEAVSMAEYVSELERFLLEEDDGLGEVPCPDFGRRVEEIGVDDYFGDLLAGGGLDGGAEAADGAGRSAEEESLAAREDEPPTSRKRARRKIKGTTMMPWGELEVTRRHVARIQVPALWLPATAALRCA